MTLPYQLVVILPDETTLDVPLYLTITKDEELVQVDLSVEIGDLCGICGALDIEPLFQYVTLDIKSFSSIDRTFKNTPKHIEGLLGSLKWPPTNLATKKMGPLTFAQLCTIYTEDILEDDLALFATIIRPKCGMDAYIGFCIANNIPIQWT